MRTLILALITLMLTQTQAYNTKYIDIYSGNTKNFDVAGQKNDLSLRWEVKSKNGFTEPAAKVISEDSDFKCTVKNNILLFSGYNQSKQTWTQSWEIKVSWQPGADLSSCLIRVSHPNEKNVYVNLYMNYKGPTNLTTKSDEEIPEEENSSNSCDPYVDTCDDSIEN
jgi:hypothetical protein